MILESEQWFFISIDKCHTKKEDKSGS